MGLRRGVASPEMHQGLDLNESEEIPYSDSDGITGRNRM